MSLVFCLDVVVIPVFPLQQLLAVDEGPLAFGQGDDLGPDHGLFGVGPGSGWSVCTVKRRFSSAFASISPSGCGPDRFVAAFSQTQLLFPEVRRDPFRFLGAFCVYAMVSPQQVVGRLRRSASYLRQVGRTIGNSGFCGASNSPDWLFSGSSFLPAKAE
jgi:hypothetical protein